MRDRSGISATRKAHWYTDMRYTSVPPIASIRYATEVPPSGGDTNFMNMYKVYDSLLGKLKLRIEDLSIKHDRSYTAVGDLRHGYEPIIDVSKSPGAIHPIVGRHPVTGSVSLYRDRPLNSYVVRSVRGRIRCVCGRTLAIHRGIGVACRHKWKVGDVVI